VVGVTLDGQEYDWRALQATPDTGARVAGRVVGDRDRIEVPLAPGAPHELTVRLVATQGGRLLVRIRQADRPDE
jgi:hypothetical protein